MPKRSYKRPAEKLGQIVRFLVTGPTFESIVAYQRRACLPSLSYACRELLQLGLAAAMERGRPGRGGQR